MSGVSKSKTAPPPFAEDDDDLMEMPPPQGSKGVVIREPLPSGSHAKGANDPKKRTELDGARLEDQSSKRHRSGKDTGVATPQANVVHHMYAKMGHQNASEAEVHSWCNADIDATIDATTKGLAEIFLRQASHAKELKNLSKDNKILKFKVHQADLDRKKLVEGHKLEMKQETELLKKDLRTARDTIRDLETVRDEAISKANAEKEKLDSDRAAFELSKKDLEDECRAQGQKIFMKKFIKKVPDFDWGVFGAAVAGYAEDLRVELVEEAQRRREELAARQAELEAKRRQDEQSGNVQDDGERDGDDAERTNQET